jgi:hypothetical protein
MQKRRMKNDLGLSFQLVISTKHNNGKSTVIVSLCRRMEKQHKIFFAFYCIHHFTGDDGYFLMFNLWCTKPQKNSMEIFSTTQKMKIKNSTRWKMTNKTVDIVPHDD